MFVGAWEVHWGVVWVSREDLLVYGGRFEPLDRATRLKQREDVFEDGVDIFVRDEGPEELTVDDVESREEFRWRRIIDIPGVPLHIGKPCFWWESRKIYVECMQLGRGVRLDVDEEVTEMYEKGLKWW